MMIRAVSGTLLLLFCAGYGVASVQTLKKKSMAWFMIWCRMEKLTGSLEDDSCISKESAT